MANATGVPNAIAPLLGTERIFLDNGGATGEMATVAQVAASAFAATLPSTTNTFFGGGTGTFLEEGNVSRLQSVAGVIPGSTGNDNVLAVYAMPANSFDIAGRGVTITAGGSLGATANNKTIKIIFNATTAVVGSAVTGGTTIASTGVVATNGGGWWIGANVFKAGAAGSNTQVAISNGTIVGTAHGGTTAPTFPVAVENAVILIAITGNAATAATDIVLNWAEFNAMN